MKTTVIIKDGLYARLVQEAVSKYGSTKKISVTLNNVLEDHFRTDSAPKNLFGCSPDMKPFERDESDRID